MLSGVGNDHRHGHLLHLAAELGHLGCLEALIKGHDRAHDLMTRFGIARLAKSLAITLSGGEKRRLAIAPLRFKNLEHRLVVQLGVEVVHLHRVRAVVIDHVGGDALAKVGLQ